MFAIISDIHSNIEALTTVLADIENRGIKTIYCLGDVIGYGVNPRECLDLVLSKTKWCVLGNHDYATLYEPTNFNYGAEQASFWTRFNLEGEPEKQVERQTLGIFRQTAYEKVFQGKTRRRRGDNRFYTRIAPQAHQ